MAPLKVQHSMPSAGAMRYVKFIARNWERFALVVEHRRCEHIGVNAPPAKAGGFGLRL
jgi:hypothetical protein